ncbi:MAG: hypothetical protein KKC28_14845 [Verrucomicrobia bacterium]|nr:hypothetical protein [Verrucomicrobiota bacterium]
MRWEIGHWHKLKEGQVNKAINICIGILWDNKFDIEIQIDEEAKRLRSSEPDHGFFETLVAYERSKGISVLLEHLMKGDIVVRAKKDECEIRLQLLLRAPENSDDNRKEFKEMIVDWVKEDGLLFCERFIRLPKINEDIINRYLDNPLEQVLRKRFGFHFEYKLIISSPCDSTDSLNLRKILYKVLDCS